MSTQYLKTDAQQIKIHKLCIKPIVATELLEQEPNIKDKLTCAKMLNVGRDVVCYRHSIPLRDLNSKVCIYKGLISQNLPTN